MKGVADGGLSAMEFASFFMLLFVAGNETTRNLISGGMLALIEHPEQRARLMPDPVADADRAVEEMLRWVSPLIYFRRTATRDIELRGAEDPRERQGRHVLRVGQPRRRRCSPIPYTLRRRRARPTSTSRSASDSTGASARTSRAWRSASCSRSCCAGMPDLELDGPVRRLRSNFLERASSQCRCVSRRARAGAIVTVARNIGQAGCNTFQSRDGEKKRSRILETAIELAEKGGFDNVRLRDVAAQAEVALGTLVQALPEQRVDPDRRARAGGGEAREAHVARRRSRAPTPLERVLSSSSTPLRGTLFRKPNLGRAVLRALTSGDQELTEQVAAFHQRMTNMIVAAFRGAPAGAARSRADQLGA